MAEFSISGAGVGNALQELLVAPDIQPGDDISYATCKTIYSYHPLGAKIADNPIAMAQSQERKISIQKGPEERLVEAFQAEWKAMGADKHIFNAARLARMYGVSSIALLSKGTPVDRPVDFNQLADADIGFNVLDPLNTSGSLVLNQDPNSLDFQKVSGVSVAGKPYHRSRTVTILNEDPLYIEYTTSAFGYVGRSVYQRALYPLKNFLNCLVTDGMIAAKAGLLVVKQKQQSSAIDGLMAAVGAVKRTLLKVAQVGSVLQIGAEDAVESLNLQNLDGAFSMARRNILEDIASAAGTPAQVINSETFAEGFGEGTEDAKRVAQYIQRIRIWMDPLYDYFTKVCQYRAWNREFYKTIQATEEDYAGKGYTQAFYEWVNDFRAVWPSLIEEPDSEKVKVDDVRLKALIALSEVFIPELDPENKTRLIQAVFDNVNGMKMLFPSPILFDADAFRDYTPPVQEALQEPKPEAPFSSKDSVEAFTQAVARITEKPTRRLLTVS